MNAFNKLVHRLIYLFDPASLDGMTDNSSDIPGWVAIVIFILAGASVVLFELAVFT